MEFDIVTESDTGYTKALSTQTTEKKYTICDSNESETPKTRKMPSKPGIS